MTFEDILDGKDLEDQEAPDTEEEMDDEDEESEGGAEETETAAPVEGANALAVQTRPYPATPRIPVNGSIDIDLVREQLENHGKVILVQNDQVYLSDRGVNLLARALHVPRVPRTSGPTHFSIPRHVDRIGNVLPCTEQWDPLNWRTRASRPKHTMALLIAKTALRVLPTEGHFTWDQIEDLLRGIGINGVYEPLAAAYTPVGEMHVPKQPEELGAHTESTGGGIKSKLVGMFRSSRDEKPSINEEALTKWHEKLATLGLTKPYIIVRPFSVPSEGVHDWAIERCAEVLRHALEWRGVQSVIVWDTAEDRGKAERLRIISGSNVAQIAPELTADELAAAVSEAQAVVTTAGPLLPLARQHGIGTVCIASFSENAQVGDVPHLVIRPSIPEGKFTCVVCHRNEHGCVDELEAGPVARALSKVLVTAMPQGDRPRVITSHEAAVHAG